MFGIWNCMLERFFPSPQVQVSCEHCWSYDQEAVDRVHSSFFGNGIGKLNTIIDIGYFYLSHRPLSMTLDQTTKWTGMFNFCIFSLWFCYFFISIKFMLLVILMLGISLATLFPIFFPSTTAGFHLNCCLLNFNSQVKILIYLDLSGSNVLT